MFDQTVGYSMTPWSSWCLLMSRRPTGFEPATFGRSHRSAHAIVTCPSRTGPTAGGRWPRPLTPPPTAPAGRPAPGCTPPGPAPTPKKESGEEKTLNPHGAASSSPGRQPPEATNLTGW